MQIKVLHVMGIALNFNKHVLQTRERTESLSDHRFNSV